MIDLGISKLALIGVVALIVIGPEKLPKVARMAGTLLGRAQRYINDVKAEVSKEIELEELRKMQQHVEQAAQQVEQTVQQSWSEAETGLRNLEEPEELAQIAPAATLSHARQDAKIKDFRRKRLAKTTALPAWYKHRHGQRNHISSGAARMARHRAQPRPPASFF
ncbi:Sec-independent protein translocase protein TatB [Undibacterium curvum]|uniref:Sec-independent protein translocase protein TatB n=1 Tax=Undibacterium curvum TaxID=2762294 RepID=A0ABR7A5X0_9BURK|nr:Sec-independent protein translocase protein TatB [Undibacterium curvum]MBC3932295.1 Sec-independent protein translocase subunit TatB [Undibacterium curvum]